MKYTIKALSPVYKAYVATIINEIWGISGVLSANLDSEDRYSFIFTVEYVEEKDLLEIMGQVKLLLRLYGSTILAIIQC